MASFQPIAAQAPLAAKLMNIKQKEFLQGVEDGVFPKGRDVGGILLWDVQQLQRIVSGDAADGMGDVKW